MKDDDKLVPKPWWKHGHVWLVIAGPAVVVVASCVTAWIAASGQDTLVAEDYYRRGMEINRQLARERALLPALQGRNHAATPSRP
ncbi:FixH family protein [Ramlibacter sp.]|uniref:FixH family protein n=1 Tax=Ramlibacter sp. TaxID=1917967 RepID=UPI00178E4A4B|nr:FixH family protein [Ramlibacter sp.]MBA2674965.1 FixH family protein [Ramlibacter sp.]